MKKGMVWHKSVITLLILYLLIPLVGTFLFSVATEWDSSILPESLTLQWYHELFQDPRFYDALNRTLFIIAMTVGLSLVIMIPTIFLVVVYLPKWERLLQGLAMLPYGIPPIIGAVGLLKIYSSGNLSLVGTPWILIGAYFVIIMPFMYQGIRNSLRTVNAIELIQTAELLGATKRKAFVRVILPNILPGVIVSILLSFAMLFGEFTLANLLVGGRYETIQIYLYQKFEKSGHLTSSIVITYYLIILLLTWGVFKVTHTRNLSIFISKQLKRISRMITSANLRRSYTVHVREGKR